MKKIILFILLVLSVASQAQTAWVVDSLNDSGFGSLRAAADSCSAGDTIRFNPNLIANGSDSIVLTSGEIAFDTVGVVIKGLYTISDTLFVSGGDSIRIFSFDSVGRIVLDSLVLVNGRANGVGRMGDGGAIARYNCTDTLFVLNSVIAKNSASGYGGGISARMSYSPYSSVMASEIFIENSIIRHNQSGSNGGGVSVYAKQSNNAPPSISSITLINSTVSNNRAVNGGGGGISGYSHTVFPSSNDSSVVNMKIINSTISDNQCDTGNGGGIFAGAYSANESICFVDVQFSTINGNMADGGGGIYTNAYDENTSSISESVVNIMYSTLVGNTANTSDGGGLYSSATSNLTTNFSSESYSTITIKNSTITGNASFNDLGVGVVGFCTPSWNSNYVSSVINISSSIVWENTSFPYYSSIKNSHSGITSGGYNIFSESPMGHGSLDITNVTARQLGLNSLDLNGGSTKTMLPSLLSVAIDAGNPLDSSIAQNVAIKGIREVGSAEYCNRSFFTDSIYSCANYYTWINGVTYVENNYHDTFVITNSAGCDSVVSLYLNLYTSIQVDTVHGCDSVVWIDGSTYFPNHGTVSDTLVNINGCDSVVFLHFISSNFKEDVLTACDSLTWGNGVTYYSNNISAIDTLISSFGCDSVVQLNLKIYPTTFSSIYPVACGTYLSPSGAVYSDSSAYFLDTLTNQYGCDSIISVDLKVNMSSVSVVNKTVCDYFVSPSGSYLWDSTGVYLDTVLNSVGCDSIISFNLMVLHSSFATMNDTSCLAYLSPSGKYYWHNSGVYKDTIPNSVNCDSVITINLTVYSTSSVDTRVACDSLTWINGITYYNSNNSAKDTLVNSVGCDSIVSLNLIIHQSYSTTDVKVVCDSLSWIDGNTYYSNNSGATFLSTSVNGCDSLVTLDLTVNHSVELIDSVNACVFYIWSDGQVYISDNNQATQLYSDVNGCDSVIVLDLKINYGSMGVDTHLVCDSLLWLDGNTYYSNNTSAIYSVPGGNAAGCDSIVTLNLTVLNSPMTVEHVFACESYTWNGITYTSSTNVSTDTLTNVAGCDSVVNLNLTIYQSSLGTDVINACDSLTWIDGVTYFSSNNSAQITFVNAVGCDSVVSLDLTILNATAGEAVISSCAPITWLDGNVYSQTIFGPTYTLVNAQGCDSVVTLDFTLLEVDTSVVRNYLTLTSQAINATYHWIDCDQGALVGENQASFTAIENGRYQVVVTQNGCVDTSACFAITNVGIQNVELIGISVYPNPTSNVLHIDKGNNTLLEITIANSAGATVYQSTSQNQITTINMAKMATGMYVVTLKNELGIKVEKVVKR